MTSDDPILSELIQARAELLAIWPRGENCEHTHAAAAFRCIDRAIACRVADLDIAAELDPG